MNNKHKSLEKELKEVINEMMLAYKEMKRVSQIFDEMSKRYESLGITPDEIFNTVEKVAKEVNLELFKELNDLEDPSLEQALKIDY